MDLDGNSQTEESRRQMAVAGEGEVLVSVACAKTSSDWPTSPFHSLFF